MKHPSHLFGLDDRQRINQAVASAESTTSAEFVVAVAGVSGRYDRSEDIIGLWAGLIAMGATWLLWPANLPERGSWGETSPGVELAALALAVVAGFVVGAAAGHRIGWLRHLFTPRRQMHEEVFSRAKQTFCDRRIYRTAEATGLLLYVSLYERIAAVVADRAIVQTLGQPALDEICRHLSEQLRQHNPTKAICSAIEVAGRQLSAVLPQPANEANELDDSLVILD